MKIFIFISAVLELEAHRKNHHQKNTRNFAVKNITGNFSKWFSPCNYFGQIFHENRDFGQISKRVACHKWSLLSMWSNLGEFWSSLHFWLLWIKQFWHFELFLGLNWNEYFRNSVLISKFILFCLSICLTKTTVAILDQFDLTLWNNHRSKSLSGLKRHFSIKKSKNSLQIILEMMSST